MKKALLALVLVLLGFSLAGCGTPPPLVSDKYLKDNSLVSTVPCGPPCFQDITVGKTTFADALTKVRANPLFSNVQSQDNPPQAAWATTDGEACCQMTADAQTGFVDAILLRVAPVMKAKEVVDKLGPPAYVSVLQEDYSADEVAMGLVYPATGNVIWIMPGNKDGVVEEGDPVVVVLYLNPDRFQELLDTATLSGWQGFGVNFSNYRAATPVLTPRVTLTPAPQ